MNLNDDNIVELVNEALENLSLNETEMFEVNRDNTLLPRIWNDTSDAILLRYFKLIMQAQVSKAIKGDTAAAKFLTEFIEPTNTNNVTGTDSARWELLAIELRNRLDLEISAEELVVKLLTSLADVDDGFVRNLLRSGNQ